MCSIIFFVKMCLTGKYSVILFPLSWISNKVGQLLPQVVRVFFQELMLANYTKTLENCSLKLHCKFRENFGSKYCTKVRKHPDNLGPKVQNSSSCPIFIRDIHAPMYYFFDSYCFFSSPSLSLLFNVQNRLARSQNYQNRKWFTRGLRPDLKPVSSLVPLYLSI